MQLIAGQRATLFGVLIIAVSAGLPRSSCAVNKRHVTEGTFIPLEGRAVPQSSDVVFIVEAKPCNENMVNRKNILPLINAISKELINNGLTNNR